jgi:hypothetical protein
MTRQREYGFPVTQGDQDTNLLEEQKNPALKSLKAQKTKQVLAKKVLEKKSLCLSQQFS